MFCLVQCPLTPHPTAVPHSIIIRVSLKLQGVSFLISFQIIAAYLYLHKTCFGAMFLGRECGFMNLKNDFENFLCSICMYT